MSPAQAPIFNRKLLLYITSIDNEGDVLKVQLVTIRLPGTTVSWSADKIAVYLERCGTHFRAVSTVARSEAALIDIVAETGKRGAAGFWMADPSGVSFSSEQFAAQIGKAREGGLRHLILAVGPADGWSADARREADLRLSLGPMTLPHELAALVLAEQIYRASTILQGHPYHLGH